ncbi:hypothetical protein AB4144_55855, partial [Rhizobiaceae sp. 2RAB30]
TTVSTNRNGTSVPMRRPSVLKMEEKNSVKTGPRRRVHGRSRGSKCHVKTGESVTLQVDLLQENLSRGLRDPAGCLSS